VAVVGTSGYADATERVPPGVQSEIRNSKSEIVNHQSSIVNRQSSIVNHLFFRFFVVKKLLDKQTSYRGRD